MGVVVTRANATTFILNDGLNILICDRSAGFHKALITESMANAIYKTLTSFKVALAMKKNYLSKPAKQQYDISDEEGTLESLTGAVLDLNKGARFDLATLFVSSNVGNVTVTGDVLLALMDVLKDAGADTDLTYGMYTNIRFVIEPPAITTMEDEVVYLLTVPYKEYAADTCFMVVRDEETGAARYVFDPETGALTPTAYGDPEDASSYPEIDPENVVSGTTGDKDTDTVEVFGGVTDGVVIISAASNVNMVNVDTSDSAVKVNIA